MQHFTNILFVVDQSKGSVSALTKVMQLAGHYGARLTLIDVLPDYSGHYIYPEASEGLTALREALYKDSGKEMDKLMNKAARKAACKVSCSTIIREGTDYIEIIRQVQEGGFDLLAKAANNNSGLGARLFGTLDLQLIRKCPCPVLVLKPRKKMVHARILAAVDLRKLPRQKQNLDEKVMQLAASLSGMEEGQLDLVHAWQLPYEKKLVNEERVALYKTIKLMNKELRETETRHLQALADEYRLLAPVTHMLKGAPEKVIPSFAANHGIDLVVMGSVGRSGVAGFFMGNTAERLLQHLDCSVLTVKPAGFKSPVK